MKPIIACERCPTNRGVFVEVAGRELAVFRLSDPERFVVLDNSCPHANGNLSGGEVVAGVVSCPWHHWKFDLGSGVCAHSDAARVQVYPSEIRDGTLFACLDE